MKCKSEYIKEDGSLDYSVYAEYFADNIQYAEETDFGKVYEGLSYDEFLISWNKEIEKNVREMAKFLCVNKQNRKERKRLEELNEFQEKLFDIGINIEFANLYFLCYYIMRVVKTGYLALLKPTPKETLAMITDVTKLTFTNADGSVVDTNYSDILNPIKDVLSKLVVENSTMYEIEKLVKIETVCNQEIFQAKFVYYLSRFLKEFFPEAKRRKNSYIVTMEQELVMYMLTFFGLGNVGISLDRYRQLFMYARNIEERFGYSYINDIGLLPMGFVKYEDWKSKRLSFISKGKKTYKPKLYKPKIGDTMLFSKESGVTCKILC